MILLFRSILLAALLIGLEPSIHAAQRDAPAAPDVTQACRYFDFRLGWLADVTWIDNSDDEHGFVLEWKGPRGQRGAIGLNANTTLATSLPSGRGFSYRVGAFRVFGPTAWSSWAHASIGC